MTSFSEGVSGFAELAAVSEMCDLQRVIKWSQFETAFSHSVILRKQRVNISFLGGKATNAFKSKCQTENKSSLKEIFVGEEELRTSRIYFRVMPPQLRQEFPQRSTT